MPRNKSKRTFLNRLGKQIIDLYSLCLYGTELPDRETLMLGEIEALIEELSKLWYRLEGEEYPDE